MGIVGVEDKEVGGEGAAAAGLKDGHCVQPHGSPRKGSSWRRGCWLATPVAGGAEAEGNKEEDCRFITRSSLTVSLSYPYSSLLMEFFFLAFGFHEDSFGNNTKNY